MVLLHGLFGALSNFKDLIEYFKHHYKVVVPMLQLLDLDLLHTTVGDLAKYVHRFLEAKDYKKVGNGDTGPNTGGMGAISPVPFADGSFMMKVKEKVIDPTIAGLGKDKLDYKGFIFFGLIKVNDEPFVIEYNCRMGDPETEVVIPRIKNDLVDLLMKTSKGELGKARIEVDNRIATTIVAVSGGYPDEYEKGITIEGLKEFQNTSEHIVFHAGTKADNGHIVTNGGRVFCATALAENMEEALASSKEVVQQIKFENKYFRTDIGYEFL